MKSLCRSLIYKEAQARCLKISSKVSEKFYGISVIHQKLAARNRLFTSSSNSSGVNLESSTMELSKVVKKLHKIASPTLAGDWDNVGLLVEPSAPHVVKTVFLTNDLTPPVLQEAVTERADLIISYHPPIFSPLKRLTQKKWKEELIVKCIENRIAVFSPHTSYDCVEAGVNDWLISCFDVTEKRPIEQHEDEPDSFSQKLNFSVTQSKLSSIQSALKSIQGVKIQMFSLNQLLDDSVDKSTVSDCSVRLVCLPTSMSAVMVALQGFKNDIRDLETSRFTKVPVPGYGMGRRAKLKEPVSIEEAVDVVKKHLKLSQVRLARAPDSKPITSVAVCAGSGSSVLRNVPTDLYITGEMSHHEVLHAVYNGTSVILCDHSNTERGFLLVIQERLTKLLDSETKIVVSKVDCDPLVIV